MGRRKTEMYAWAISGFSFVLAILLFIYGPICSMIPYVVFAILFPSFLVLWIVAMIVAITYSEEGWTVRGSTLEWIIATMISWPVALFLYFTKKLQEEPRPGKEPIDPDDHDRIDKL